jgi:hypothetical protein
LLSFFIYRPFKVVHVEFQFINVPQGIYQRGNFLRTFAAKNWQVRFRPAIEDSINKHPPKIVEVVVIKELCAASVAAKSFAFFVKNRHHVSPMHNPSVQGTRRKRRSPDLWR